MSEYELLIRGEHPLMYDGYVFGLLDTTIANTIDEAELIFRKKWNLLDDDKVVWNIRFKRHKSR